MAPKPLTPSSESWVLNTLRLPGRLNAAIAAQLIGCAAHDIPTLIRFGLLKPLGGGPKNSVKYFAATDLEQKLQDVRWLDKVTKALSRRTSTSCLRDTGRADFQTSKV